jgi:hypothetical protein
LKLPAASLPAVHFQNGTKRQNGICKVVARVNHFYNRQCRKS